MPGFFMVIQLLILVYAWQASQSFSSMRYHSYFFNNCSQPLSSPCVEASLNQFLLFSTKKEASWSYPAFTGLALDNPALPSHNCFYCFPVPLHEPHSLLCPPFYLLPLITRSYHSLMSLATYFQSFDFSISGSILTDSYTNKHTLLWQTPLTSLG